MLTQFQYYSFFLLFFSIFFCSPLYNSNWGDYEIDNNSLNIKNKEIENIVNNQIEYINSLFPSVNNKRKFKIIITDYNPKQKLSNTWEWSLGYIRGHQIIIKDPANTHISKNRFVKVLRHEINHLYLNKLNNKVIPRWFQEGFAMKYAKQNHISYKLNVANELSNKDLFNINHLDEKFNTTRTMFDFAYGYSLVLIEYLSIFYGEKTINKIINNLKDGNNFEDSFFNATSINLDEFNIKLVNYIDNKYRWLNLIKFPNFILVLAPFLLFIGFIFKKLNNQKLLKKWEIEEELLDLQNDDEDIN